MSGFPTHVDRGGFRFFSGVTAVRPGSAASATSLASRAESEHRAQAEGIFDWLEQQMAEAGGIAGLARLHLYQQDKRTFPILEGVRMEREGDEPAPSSGIGVGVLRDDPTTKYEIDGIAFSDEGFRRWGSRTKIDDGAAGRSASHYSQAVRLGPYFFLAGMIPIDVDTGEVVQGYGDIDPEDRWLAAGRSHTDSRRGPIVSQTVSLLRRIFATADGLGASKSKIVNCTMYIERPLDYADAVRVYDELFGDERPALQVVVVDEVGHKETIIEIECTVAVDGASGRIPYPGLDDVPAAVETADLGFFSDQIGLDSSGLFPTDPTRTLSDAGIAAVRSLASDPDVTPLDDDLAAQTGLALTNLLDAVEASSYAVEDIGALQVQVARPSSVTAVGRLLEALVGDMDVAVTILSVKGLGHHPGALVAMSAVCGRS